MSDPSEYDQFIRPPAEEHLSDALAAFGQDLTNDPVWQDSITFGLFLELHQIQPGQVQPWWHSPDEYLPSQAARLGLRRASPTQHVRLAAKSNNCRPASEDTKTRQCHRGCLPAFWYELPNHMRACDNASSADQPSLLVKWKPNGAASMCWYCVTTTASKCSFIGQNVGAPLDLESEEEDSPAGGSIPSPSPRRGLETHRPPPLKRLFTPTVAHPSKRSRIRSESASLSTNGEGMELQVSQALSPWASPPVDPETLPSGPLLVPPPKPRWQLKAEAAQARKARQESATASESTAIPHKNDQVVSFQKDTPAISVPPTSTADSTNSGVPSLPALPALAADAGLSNTATPSSFPPEEFDQNAIDAASTQSDKIVDALSNMWRNTHSFFQSNVHNFVSEQRVEVRRLGSLVKQFAGKAKEAEKARDSALSEGRHLREQLTSTETRMAVYAASDKKAKSERDAALSTLENERASWHQARRDLEKDREVAESRRNDAVIYRDQASAAADDMVVEVEKLEERLREIEAETAEIKEKMLQVEKDAEELSGQRNQAVKDLERAHEERDAIKSELSAAQARIRELEALSGGAEPSAATANPPDAGPTPTPHN